MQRAYQAIVLTLLAVSLAARSTKADDAMKLTLYDDGISCPGNCDAHVVINPDDNGTRFAFDPASSRASPRPCTVGQECRICFGTADDTCMSALYRGGGPPKGTFDFTPAFYREQCSQTRITTALRNQCDSLDKDVRDKSYDAHINCLANPSDSHCKAIITEAEAKREADIPKRDQCLKMGEDTYNKKQTDPRERRANNCDYSFADIGGPNSKGVTWRVLLPAACRPGTYVGQNGTDCCSSDVRFAASVHPECSSFFPAP
jgi:hypothetical protein